ncbi:peptide chain release factor 3 [Candidatus Pantoea carbekii]|uniref:Peptide chain release factor 3 n=1 Tax=Candidatus Pantoea carbekii TaxID=1235990 RepID=U3U7C8_9GAMM|nr:peptide chain release factor 3 [Candidatus Pantoea carbekii]AKC32556.1 peptide chain release factor 3 PrfC [Candidatus Pantoea carbekii]BAO00287.1 peptide chain release factor 3 [Candidatus Pantoea carbekii]
MSNIKFLEEVNRRRTFAIISHPDAGKTTFTEKVLLFGKVIQTAGTIKGRGSNGQYVKSDWMEMEKERGISITTSVMQFPYCNNIVNLLDTPGHEDFSEDTYRTLTAVDSCLMIIDATKGVEERTRKLIEVTRLRSTPIITFMNKCDRDIRDPIDLLDEIENELRIACALITWPIGCGKLFKGVYHLYNDQTYLYQSGKGHTIQPINILKGLYNYELDKNIGNYLAEKLRDELKLLKGVLHEFDQKMFVKGEITPVFFGSALGNFGINHMLDGLISWAPCPIARQTNIRIVNATEEQFSGFVFKIQANMDRKHRDRIAFIRIVSGKYKKGMNLYQVRTRKNISIFDALTFMGNCRVHVTESYPGDIIGIHNHGTIQIGDTFTQGENIKFQGIPNFAPELFRRIRLRNPLKQKQLLKGLVQLSEEGAVQVFRLLYNKELIVGVIGILQFDMVVERLKSEYNVEAIYEPVNIVAARWIECSDVKKLQEFQCKNMLNLAVDNSDKLTYIAPTMINLNIVQERYPEIIFQKIREH